MKILNKLILYIKNFQINVGSDMILLEFYDLRVVDFDILRNI